MNTQIVTLTLTRTFGLGILCAVAVSAQVIGEYKIDTARRLPAWSNGSLVSIGKSYSPLIVIYVSDANGHDRKKVVLPVPGAAVVTVTDYTLASDGTVALCGTAADSAGRATHFIAFIDPNGTAAGITSTGTFAPERIVFAEDGTVWVAGAVLTGTDSGNVFRYFDRGGRMIGGLIPQTTLSSSLEMRNANTFFTANSGRVAWINRNTYKYLGFTEDGRLERAVSPAKPGNSEQRLTGIALQRDGTLVLSSTPVPQTTPRTSCLFSLAPGDAGFSQVRCSAGLVFILGAHGCCCDRSGRTFSQDIP